MIADEIASYPPKLQPYGFQQYNKNNNNKHNSLLLLLQ